jgi:hypothetical protein
MTTRRRALTTSASNAHTVASTFVLGLAGVSYLIVPGALSAAAAGLVWPLFSPVWVAGLILGGILVPYGILAMRPRVEIVGLALLGGSVTFAALAVFDVKQATAIPTGLFYLSSGLSCFFRIGGVVYLERVRDRVARNTYRTEQRFPSPTS